MKFGVNIIRMVEDLPKSKTTDVVGKQLLRCGTSVGANYRAACRAKSPPDFISKMRIVEEEADESIYWMEVLKEVGYADHRSFPNLLDEANQLVSITVASIKTARNHKARS